MKIAVTGAQGLLGWHTAARLHALNCTARYAGKSDVHDLVLLNRQDFQNADGLATRLRGVEAILHFAGVNRGSDLDVAEGNPWIATRLVEACCHTGAMPVIVYANSTHAATDSLYGRSKRDAGEILSSFAGAGYCDLILPHVFGECARPRYNNVTATLIEALWAGEAPDINPAGRVCLVHAGEASQLAINAVGAGARGHQPVAGRDMAVTELWDRLKEFHQQYDANVFPDLTDPFDLALFNTFRIGGFPDHYPRRLQVNRDQRGALFESAKGGASPHTFLSTTMPGRTRGDHFHLSLVERFLVVSGEATIRIRKVLSDQIHEFAVSGNDPVAIDMPPMHTHHIENSSPGDVVTFFWSHRIFDPANPDTYADPVR